MKQLLLFLALLPSLLCGQTPFAAFPAFGGSSDVRVKSVFTGRNGVPNEVYSDPSVTSITCRKALPVRPGSKITGLQVIFGNFTVSGTQEVAMPDTISVSCRVVVGGVNTRFTFGGVAVPTMAPGTILASDILPVTVDPAVTPNIFVDSYASNPAPTDRTKLWPSNYRLFNELGDGVMYGQNYTPVGAAAPPTITAGAEVRGFSPIMIVGHQLRGPPLVIIVGDSIACGQGDVSGLNQTTAYSDNEYGFIERALDARGIAYLRVAKPGDRLSAWNTPGYRTLTKSLFSYGFDTMIFEYGVNDLANLTNFSTMVAMTNTMFADARSRGIKKIYQTTVTSKTTSSNFYRTTEGQTIAPGFTAGGAREQYNAWILAGSGGGSDGVLDVAGTVESAPNSGKWKPAPTVWSGTVSSATSTSFTVAGAGWTPAQFQNHYVVVTGGTGFPQTNNVARAIRSNSATVVNCIYGQGFSPALGSDTTVQIYLPASDDGLHPSSEGHRLMSAPIIAFPAFYSN